MNQLMTKSEGWFLAPSHT